MPAVPLAFLFPGETGCRSPVPLFALHAGQTQLYENATTLSLAFATLTRRVQHKSFVCHSYGTPGWGYSSQQDPATRCASMQERPQLQCLHLLTDDSLDTPGGTPPGPIFPSHMETVKDVIANLSTASRVLPVRAYQCCARWLARVVRSKFPPTSAILR